MNRQCAALIALADAIRTARGFGLTETIQEFAKDQANYDFEPSLELDKDQIKRREQIHRQTCRYPQGNCTCGGYAKEFAPLPVAQCGSELLPGIRCSRPAGHRGTHWSTELNKEASWNDRTSQLKCPSAKCGLRSKSPQPLTGGFRGD